MISLDYQWTDNGIQYSYSGNHVCDARYRGEGCYVMIVGDDALSQGGNFATAVNGITFPNLKALEYAALSLAEAMSL